VSTAVTDPPMKDRYYYVQSMYCRPWFCALALIARGHLKPESAAGMKYFTVALAGGSDVLRLVLGTRHLAPSRWLFSMSGFKAATLVSMPGLDFSFDRLLII
jgi:hypothetical protein